MKKLITILFLLATILFNLKAQNTVSIDITGIENKAGKLYVALFDSKSTFLSNKATGKIVDTTGETTNVSFENITAGDYAVAIFFDENNNGKLDLGQYGIPTEKYGFSNNVDPAIIRRVPVFDECKFPVADNTKVTIKLVSANDKEKDKN